jgi:(1->4)-alpha-D-glucan 1-alpha-D-glucosylmutase
MSDALRRLADAHGIVAEYHDIWGRRHETSDATRRALLGAMHVSADSEDDIAASLVVLEHQRWDEAIAPLTVQRHGRPAQIDLRLREAAATQQLALVLTTEDGDQHRLAPLEVARVGEQTLDGVRRVHLRAAFAHGLEPGYYRLEVRTGDELVAHGELAIAPADCYRPAALRDGGRTWGLALQLYALRSQRNWGIGDFSDLAAVVRSGGPHGFGLVGVNPLHALFPHNPRHCSPYSPSSRLFLNVLYIDVTAVIDFGECREAQEEAAAAGFARRLEAARRAERVDYGEVAALKLGVLRRLHRHFREVHRAQRSERARQFEAFVAAGGIALQRHAAFEALQEHFHAADPSVWGWPAWPPEYRDPAAPAVASFVEAQRDAVDFYLYLQWQAQLQLAACATYARAARLSLGLYTDLSVSVDRAGAEAWANQDLYAIGASIGAPPDDFNVHGQDWGLPPLIPSRLRQSAYAPFIATLRAGMRSAAALRIDHVMGLMRLFWVPASRSAADGAYVRYPFDDLLGLVALESHRNRCMVVGEDLGTVPEDVRSALAANDVLSYRVLPFERDSTGAFKPVGSYPEAALVTAGTHDLPTVAGWWAAHDIDLRHRCGLASDEARAAQLAERARDRQRLGAALGADGAESPPLLAAQAFLARTPSALLAVQPEDVFGALEQANLPGTTDQHPNWQRKLEVPVDDWFGDARFDALAERLQRERPDPRSPEAPVPRATYRLQLHGEFTFADATALVPYLHALGISHVYCSPYLRARPGSRHGYDIVDHGELNPEIGSRADFERFVHVLRQHGMGHIVDIVPNHMGVMGADNAWWMDVLEHGRASRYAAFFDIDWSPADRDLANRVLVPVLGAPYGDALTSGDLELRFEAERGAFAIWFHEHRFPLDPATYPQVLGGIDDPSVRARLAPITEKLQALAPRDDARADPVERAQAAEGARRELAALAAGVPTIAAAIEPAVRRLAGDADGLHALLEAQAYRLANWRVAFDEINYRRFFDINDLAALRMEHRPAFDATHRFVLDLAASAMVDGLRIDHPDGLYDPAQYFARVQSEFARRAGLPHDAATRPLYLVIEKIIAPHEHLCESWRVHGTTGYRFINASNGLLVDTGARARIDRTWRAFAGAEADDFETMAYHARRAMLRGPLAAGLTVLANDALALARSDRATRDHTRSSLQRALEDIAASFPVYRTYVSGDGAGTQDRRYVDWAIARARRHSRAVDAAVFELLHSLLLGEPAALGMAREQCLRFAMRFQQLTAPVAAKGIEDTTFYRFNRLLSLAEVGGDPDQFGMTSRAFHGASADRAARWSATMVASSTHDNKRSEDVRARIDVLSEVPAVWRLMLRRWARLNRSRKHPVDDVPAPSRNDEYFFYQTLIGSWPAEPFDRGEYRRRIRDAMIKAVREAKVHTSWAAPNEPYETALTGFADFVLADGDNLFVDELRQRVDFFRWFGLLNSVTLAIVKLTSPGVPDFYQGNELLDFSLVDPDNRRRVDYALRRALLAELETLARQPADAIVRALPALFDASDGRAKLWVVQRLLQSRCSQPALYQRGDYRPLKVRGERADNVIAYARRHEGDGLIVVAGRFFTRLAPSVGELPLGAAWGDSAIEIEAVDGLPLSNVLTGESLRGSGRLPVAQLFTRWPGAVLTFRVA